MLPEPTFEDLKDCSFEELETYFRQGSAPSLQEMTGDTKGAFLVWNPESGRLIKLMVGFMFRHWLGKRFHEPKGTEEVSDGINLFSKRPLTRYRFLTNIGTARMDGKPCLRLDYNIKGSLRGLVDDVQKIGEGLVLGQIYYKFFWQKKAKFLLYFTLARKS